MSNFSEEKNKQTTALKTPYIPVALTGGLLPIHVLTSPVIVNLEVWAGARPRYTYQLLWNSVPIGIEKEILDSENPGDTLTLELPTELLFEGHYKLAYRVFNPLSQVANNSPEIPIEIDLTAPGNPLIAAMIFPASTQDGLTSTELEELGDVLEAAIASYSDMKEGDVIRTYWGTTEGPPATVDKDDMGLKKVTILFTRDFLQNFGDIEAGVYYTVTDRAGNKSKNSEPVMVKLLLSVVTPLPNPKVKEAKEDGTLDPADTTVGATVIVDATANLKRGDVVSVTWQGPVNSDFKEKTISASQAGKELSVIFSGALVAVNVGRTVQVSYIVTRASGVDQPSGLLELLITAGLSNLEKPKVLGVINDALAPETVPETGVVVTVPSYTGMAVKDSIVVKWSGGPSHITAPQVVGVVGEINFTVPTSVAVGSAGSSASVTYEVTRNGAAPVVSAATTFNVQALLPALIVDTSDLVLNARHLRTSATPAHPPAGAFAQRSATGGVAPYRYESSAPKIAEVDATGRVVSVGNGDATITVTDDGGQSVSYGVKTSNVLTFVLFSFNTYTESTKAISNGGAHVPSLGDWGALRANYGGDPGLTYTGGGRYHRAWATDGAGVAKRWAIYPEDGRKEALKDVGFGGDAANGFGMKS